MSCCGQDGAQGTRGRWKLLAGGAAFLLLIAVLALPAVSWSKFTGDVETTIERALGTSPSADDIANLPSTIQGLAKEAGREPLQVGLTIESRMGPNLQAKQFLIVELHAGSREHAAEWEIQSSFDEEAQERLRGEGVQFTSKRPKGHHH